jgi:hypothetical protein
MDTAQESRMPPFSPLRTRQVHLDFHTSEHIPEIGAEFNERQFIGALKKGRVNSVTVFAMCHHGWCYYDTAVGEPHPGLATNLLPRMLRACRANRIEAPVYITVGWNERAAARHPGWMCRNPDGTAVNMPPPGKPDDPRPWGWRRLCLNTPYIAFIERIAQEVVERFQPVGLFFDIVDQPPCHCAACRRGMKARGLDPADPAQAAAFAASVTDAYCTRMAKLVWGLAPGTRIFQNGPVKKGRPDLYATLSHYEIESLPTAGWGYDHFPPNALYFAAKGVDFLGMTGKFHKSWGEFGGFKSAAALRHECRQMMALGAKCSVGDQLHPSGRMDEETYSLIGEAYRDVARIERWCTSRVPVADVGVLCQAAAGRDRRQDDSETGAAMMLLETQTLFALCDASDDWSAYRVLVLPDSIAVDAGLKGKLEAFLDRGGRLLLSGESGLNPDRTRFALDLGADYAGPSPWQFDYTLAGPRLARGLVRSPFLNYEPAVRTTVRDAAILAGTVAPYFNRTYRHFCSHANTPPRADAGYPAAVRKGNILYLAHPVFRQYRQHGLKLHRDLVANALRLLLPTRTVEAVMPSAGRVTLMRKPGTDGLVMHLLYATPIKRGSVEVLEDIVPLHDVAARVNLPGLARVRLIPENKPLPAIRMRTGLSFTIPEVRGHRMLLIS